MKKYFFNSMRNPNIKLVGLLTAFVVSTSFAGQIAQSPLFITPAVKPNIMLMFDNSGSMSNVLIETDKVDEGLYNPNQTYQANCPSSNLIEPCTTFECVKLTVNSGIPYISHNGSQYRLGKSSGQKCFSSTGVYSAQLIENSNTGDADYNGNYLNWYFDPTTSTGTWGSRKPQTNIRMDVAKAAANTLVDGLDNVRLGLATYKGTWVGEDGGSLLELVEDVDVNTTKKQAIKKKINDLQPVNQTPLAETLLDIGHYFTTGNTTNNLTLHPDNASKKTESVSSVFTQGSVSGHNLENNSGQTVVPPILSACQKSFAVLMTDGRPHFDRDINSLVRDYTGDCSASTPLCKSNPNDTKLPATPLLSINFENGTKIGRSYEEQGSDYLDDVAKALFEMDLRPDITKTTGQKNNLITYAIGFADPVLANDQLLHDAASRGGGLFKSAENQTQLQQAFDAIVSDIGNLVDNATSTTLATNSKQLDISSKIYQAGFGSKDWSGSLKAFSLSTTNEDANGNGVLDTGEDTNSNNRLDLPGSIVDTPVWTAENTMPSATARRVLSYNPAITTVNKGIIFEWVNLSASQKTALDAAAASASAASSNILDYIRGDQTKEATGLRVRTTVLGDIVNSDPYFVGKNEDYGYSILSGDEGSSYITFRTTGKINRTNTLYVGANDGMLHAFNADNGQELFAYVPNAVFPALNKLTEQKYGCQESGCTPHEYFVDGAARADDAYFGIGTGTASWRTVLLGSTGAGSGKAVFALDVTNPNPSNSTTVSTFSADNVLWEISPQQAPKPTDLDDDATVTPVRLGFKNNLGYSIPQSATVRMQNGRWAAIIPNGYKSVSNKAVLFIVDIASGEIIRSIDTLSGSSTLPNGLSTPFVADTDGDRIADFIYAGDLLGNMWKFDVRDTNVNNWGVAFSSGSPATPTPLYTACSTETCSDTNRQPITTKPQVGRHPAGGFMVYFGTGKYYEAGDHIIDSTTQIQSFYGIRDQNTAVANRSLLLQQSILGENVFDINNDGTNDTGLRTTSSTVVDYIGNATASPVVAAKQGWYMNLIPPSGVIQGERLVSNPILRSGRIIFVTLLPSKDACKPGGSSWLMELDAVNGSNLSDAPFDVNNDGYVNFKDKKKGLFGTSGNGSNDEEVVVNGRQTLDGGSSKGVTIIKCGEFDCKIMASSDGTKKMVKESQGSKTGRQSWRQIR